MPSKNIKYKRISEVTVLKLVLVVTADKVKVMQELLEP